MKIEHKTRIDKAADSDAEGRWQMNHVEALASSETRGFLTATDGRILAVVHEDMENVHGKQYIPAKCFNANQTQMKKGAVVKDATVDGKEGCFVGAKGTLEEADESVRFPNCLDIVQRMKPTPEHQFIVMDLQLLMRLAESLNDREGIDSRPRCLALFIPRNDDAIVAVGTNGIGAAMPLTSNDNDRAKYEAEYAAHLEQYEQAHEMHKLNEDMIELSG